MPFQNEPLPGRGALPELPAATIVRQIEELLVDGDSLPSAVKTRLESLHRSALDLASAPHPVINLDQAQRRLAEVRNNASSAFARARRHLESRRDTLRERAAPAVKPAAPTMFTGIQPAERHVSGGLASGLLHCAVVALLLTISPALFKQAAAIHRSIVYIAPPVAAPPTLKKARLLPAPPVVEQHVTFTPRVPAREIPKPLIEAPPVLAVNAPKPYAIAAPKIIAAVPPPPVQTNLFRQLNAELVPQSSPVPVREAGFDHKANLVVPAGAPSSAVIARTGFDQPVNASAVAQAGAVQTGRFSSGRETALPVMQGSASRTSFDRPAASASAPEKTVAAAITPRRSVEILDKPRPRYTDEARKAKIEGTVFLEVTFTAAGQIQVHRVVKGLGYGLDQSAIEAAQQIRFKPATMSGAPVDQTAIVQVLFQISE